MSDSNGKKNNMDYSLSTLKQKYLETKILILIFAVSIVIGVLSGFFFKTHNAKILDIVLEADSEWRHDAFLELVDARNGFFYIDEHDFNFLAFALGTIITAITIIYIRHYKIHQKVFKLIDEIK
jgi:hypothetical protein